MFIMLKNKSHKKTVIVLLSICIVFLVVIAIISIRSTQNNTIYKMFSDCSFHGVTPINTTIINYNNNIDFCDIVFINSTEGWKLKYLDAAMFYQKAALYKTNDSGKTWVEINTTEKTVPGESKTGITFINREIGWITTETPREGYIGLYKTTDGGLSWSYQEVDIPDNYRRCLFNIYPPVFFTENDGIFITYQTDIDEQLVYITHDKGNSWTITAKDVPNGNLSWATGADGNFLDTVTYNNTTWVPTIMHRYRTWEVLK